MSNHKRPRQLMAIIMSIILLLGMEPITALADTTQVNTGGEITSFETLAEETSSQTVSLGTAQEELNLPDILQAMVRLETVAEDQTIQITENAVSLPVTWSADTEYNSDTEGVFIFTPILPLQYTLSSEASLPQISVTVMEMESEVQYVANTASSIYTVSTSPSTEMNISWSELGEKMADGTIKSGDTLQIIETTTLISRLIIPATITELTIEGDGTINLALPIQCDAANMRLILKDISLSAYLEPSIMFAYASELVVEGEVTLESNSRVILCFNDLTISGSGNLNVIGIERNDNGMEAVASGNLIIDSTGTLTFRGGSGKENGGYAINCTGNVTLNSGSVYMYGGLGGSSGGTGNGGIALQCMNLTVSEESELTAEGGDSSNRHGGVGIYCANNITLEAGIIYGFGGNGGNTSGDGANGIQCNNLILRGNSDLVANGGSSYMGITGIGINCTYFTFDSSGTVDASGGGVFTFLNTSGKAINSTYPINVSGSGSIRFVDGAGQIPIPLNAVSFTTDLEGTWNVDPSNKLLSGNLTDRNILVKSGHDEYITVTFEGKSKPVLSIISQPEDITVTEGLIFEGISVWASVSINNITKSYQWFKSDDGSDNGTAVPGATSSVFYLPNDLTVGEYYYYCEISAPDADSIKTNVVKVTVIPRGPFSGGDGTEGDPYQIATAEELENLSELINDSTETINYNTKYYILTADIDLIEYTEDGGWIPIGDADAHSFKGHFDGMGHKITGLTINRTQPYYQGLFGVVSMGTIQNLGLEEVNVIGESRTGGLAGFVYANSVVQNCYVTGSVTGGASVGGLVGTTLAPMMINNCYTTTTVTGARDIGGIVGSVISGTVKNCYSTGTIIGLSQSQNIGGIVGYAGNSTIVQNCAALNLSVRGQSAVGRVCGNIETANVTNNVATTHMQVLVNGVVPVIIGDALDRENGQSKTALQLCVESGFPSTLTQSPWVYTEEFYPTLEGTDGGTMPVQELIPVILAVTNIKEIPTTATAGTDLTLTGYVTPASATFKAITWTIKSPGTTGATMNGNILSTTAAGTVIVTATITHGVTANIPYIKDFTITVDEAPPVFEAVTNITGVPTTATAGTDVTLTGTVVPANATNKTIVWSIKSPGTTGATRTGNILSTTAAGTVIVTATIANGDIENAPYTQDFTITVSEAPPAFQAVTNITGVPTTATAGTDVTLTGTVVPANATNKTIVWSIKSPGTTGASRTGNILSTTAAGTVIVTATIANGDIENSPYTQDFTITITAVSNGGSGSNPGDNSGNPNNSGTTPSTGTEQITVDVKQGNSNSVASQITIERTTKNNGEKSDKVTYQEEKATETVEKLIAEGKDTARILIPDTKDEVSETNIYIPTTSIGILAKGKINLQIDTEEAKISLSIYSVDAASKLLTDDLYFRLVPVKNEEEKEVVLQQAKLNAVLVSNDENSTVTVIGNPITIETNMPAAETIITLPLTGIVIPTNTKEREALLKQLAVYIEHSDGEKVMVQGELVEYKEGQYGVSFHIKKFSTFTVVKTDAFLKSAEKSITKITTPANAVIKGSNITATVENDMSSITIKAIVSNNATWKLYLDKDLKKEVTNKKLKLTTGGNTGYIKVIAQDKSSKIYKLTITRNKSSKSDITKVIVPEKAVMRGSIITASVDSEKSYLTIKAQVSSNASYKLYSDKALKKEISNRTLNLKEGINTVYLKVTAEDGKSTKVYMLKITRKTKEYKSHISLGLIGSENYANIVAKIFKQEYDTANVVVKGKGKYFLVTMNFKNKAEALKSCKDMIRRQYIVNYYFN